MRGCFAVCGWFALCLALAGFGSVVIWLPGCRVVWLAWFGVADRVVYEVRSGWVVAGYCFFIVVFHMPYAFVSTSSRSGYFDHR